LGFWHLDFVIVGILAFWDFVIVGILGFWDFGLWTLDFNHLDFGIWDFLGEPL